MKTQKKYEKRNGIALILGAVLIAGASATLTAGICTDWFRNNPFEQGEKDPSSGSSGLNTSIKEDGVSLKLLATTTTSEGYVVKTFSFTITPANATDQTVNAEAKYKDGSDASAAIAVSVDNEAKTISLTNKGAFSKQIVVTVTSNDNAQAKATITVDYVKKVTAITPKANYSSDGKTILLQCGFSEDYQNEVSGNYIDDFAEESLIEVSYSIYTKNKNYTFAVKDVEVTFDHVIWFDENEGQSGGGYLYQCTEFTETLRKTIEEKIASKESITVSDIYNAGSSTEYHNYLKGMDIKNGGERHENYITYSVSATYYCVEDPTKEFKFGGSDHPCKMEVSLTQDYSNFHLGVSGITVEVPSIEF